jgi:hypothetical protein
VSNSHDGAKAEDVVQHHCKISLKQSLNAMGTRKQKKPREGGNKDQHQQQ